MTSCQVSLLALLMTATRVDQIAGKSFVFVDVPADIDLFPRWQRVYDGSIKGCVIRRLFVVMCEHDGEIPGAVKHSLNPDLAMEHTEENHIASQGCHPQAERQIFSASIAHRGGAEALVLLHELANKPSGICPAVFDTLVTDAQKVLPGLRGMWSIYAARTRMLAIKNQ